MKSMILRYNICFRKCIFTTQSFKGNAVRNRQILRRNNDLRTTGLRAVMQVVH